MARRKELTGIAHGIAQSFNSRNNDVNGYWGIGKLYKFVEHSSDKYVVLDLINQLTEPKTNEFDSLILFYRNMLLEHLSKRDLRREWVISVDVIVSFDVEASKKHHQWRSSLGNPCVVECVIQDDMGRKHIAHAYNNCFPHNPKRERRSTRASDY